MRIVIQLILLPIFLGCMTTHAATSEQSLSILRKTFLQAEQYIQQDRESDFFALVDTLKDYPLYPYLQYQWLTHHLQDNAAILSFMQNHPTSRYTPLLHSKWLKDLGQKQNWLTFVQHYKNSQDRELDCYFALARYQLGEQSAAIETAKQFWLSGQPQPPACDALWPVLQNSAEFKSELIWQRFQNAFNQNNISLAKQMLVLMPRADRDRAEIWLNLQAQPSRVAQAAFWKKTDPQAGMLFAHSILNLLDTDPESAMHTWDAEKNDFQIPPDKIAEVERRLGLELSFRRDHRAYHRLTSHAGNDQSAQEWRVRAALSQQDWPKVLTASNDLNPSLKQEDKWRFWQARALAETGQSEAATAIYQDIAKNRSFYAFLAADKLQQALTLNDHPLLVSSEEIEQLQTQNEFLVTRELLAIDRKTEAARQWWHAITDLDRHQLKVAAKLAQQWDWPSIAIFTLAKANDWDDMTLRFPLQYTEQVQANAENLQLEPALLLALIRQESAFDPYAGSSAGAMGLMQLMPKTARQIAAESKVEWNNDYNLLSPTINIQFGSAYFKKLLNQFDGNIILATAAYNAGSLKARSWLPKNQALPADIWIETIPYKETRGYVASVIMYTLIYQQRLNRNPLKVAELLREIKPN
jgi:soluble lytic murein transglycosylase